MPRLPSQPLLLCVAFAVLACGGDDEVLNIPLGGQAFPGSVESGGRTRTYQVWVPTSVTRADSVPLVIGFHGAGSVGSDFRAFAGLDAMSEPLEMIIVYPNAAASDWADGCACSNAEQQGIDDVRFLRDLVADLAADYTFDPERVFLAGISQGGLFAQYAACQAPDLVAGFAVVASSLARATAAACDLQQPMPALLIHGTQDPVIPYTGSTSGSRPVLPAEEAVSFWLGVNGCAAAPTETTTIDPVLDQTRTIRRRYADCEGGSEVIFFEVQGGGHTWPNTMFNFSPSFGRTSRDFQAADDIGLFFDRH
ncbi:MAG TPA: PHB depolymerase family esterase [Longimicrobiales bacterium]|nr:PHB depolymerase family esterase [Longimicrobiales bacterium]